MVRLASTILRLNLCSINQGKTWKISNSVILFVVKLKIVNSATLTAEKMPAKQVEIVLYHKDVLAEDNERSTDADWEIVSINASPVKGDMPIAPGVLMANHFHWSGGTVTNMSDEEFVKQLKISAEWWIDKCLLEPRRTNG